MSILKRITIAATILSSAAALRATVTQAENYSAMHGIATEATTDTGGGLDVGWLDPGDTIDYLVNIPTAGAYKIDLRFATTMAGKSIEIDNTGNVLATVALPNTGGWQAWQTISATINLPAGAQTLRFTTTTGDWNLNWFDLNPSGPVPIQAESYSDSHGIATEPTTDVGGGLDVGWLDAGDYLKYTISPAASGNYQIALRVASTSNNNSIEVRSATALLATVPVPNTGGWQNWQTITATIPLTAGAQTLELTTTTGNWNLNWFTLAPSTVTGQRIPITEDMVVNELGFRDERGSFLNLFDEESGVTTSPPTNTPTTHWRIAGAAWEFPAGLVIDLGQEYDISTIYWYDGSPMVDNGYDIEVKGGALAVETGAPFHWAGLFSQNLVNDAAWHNYATTTRTRYIHILKNSTQTYYWRTYDKNHNASIFGPYAADAPLLELAIYGTPVGAAPAAPTNQHTPLNVPMDKMTGGVSWWNNVSGVASRYTQVSTVRAYHGNWRTGSDTLTGLLDFNELYDLYYQTSAAVTDVYPCLQGNYHGGKAGTSDHADLNKPLYSGGSAIDAASYIVHGDNLYQWVARYGHNSSMPNSNLRPMYQRYLKGAGWISSIEDWNEPDQWWNGRDCYFSPYEFGAMLSADYDGHLGQLGATIGAKNADPTIRFLMGGLASFTPDYVKGIQLWANEYRGGSFPADVLNFHHYDQNPYGSAQRLGASPESDHLYDLLSALVRYRNLYQPTKEVWLTEFGWDTLYNYSDSTTWSTQLAATHALWPSPGYDSVDLQANWILRALLIGAKAGIDRMTIYSVEQGTSTGTYDSCGIEDYNGNPKKSYYYVATIRQALANMIYVGEKASGNSNVWIYKFKSLTNNSGTYVLWCPTSDGTTVSQYSLSLSPQPTSATLVTCVNGSTTGNQSALTIQSGAVNVDVSEQPVFVKVDNISSGP